MIIKTKIHGTTFHKGYERIPLLNIGYKLELVREPENQYDKNAIRINNGSGQQLGHVPRLDAAALAPLMDGGTEAEAFVSSIVGGGDLNWGVRIRIEY